MICKALLSVLESIYKLNTLFLILLLFDWLYTESSLATKKSFPTSLEEINQRLWFVVLFSLYLNLSSRYFPHTSFDFVSEILRKNVSRRVEKA